MDQPKTDDGDPRNSLRKTIVIFQIPPYCIVSMEILTFANLQLDIDSLAEMSDALFGGLLTGAHFTFQPPRQRHYLSWGPYAECPYKSIFILSPQIFIPDQITLHDPTVPLQPLFLN